MVDRYDYTRTMRIDLPPQTVAQVPGAVAPAAVDVAKLVEHRSLFHKQNAPYNRLLNSIYDAVFITDGGGVILDYNERAPEFLLFKTGEALGRSILNFISGAEKSLLEEVAHNLESYKYTVVEAFCSRTDGTTFPAEIAITSIRDDGEKHYGFFIRDISVRVKTQQDLRNAVERLEALDRARLEFVSNVSHELRTPLTSMIYAVRNMQRGVAGPLPEKALQYLERLHSDCRRLQGTVNDILDIQQIENDKLTLTPSKIPLGRLVEVGVDSLRVQAEEKHVRMIFCRPAEVFFVDCDVNKIERVVLNIVGNAIKFTPEDGLVEVGLRQAEDERVVTLTVRDSGVGIPPEALDRITVRYFKVGDQPIGTGLGLAISRELVELHGGKLQIESPVPGRDCGTEVMVTLPMSDSPRIMLATANKQLATQIEKICGIARISLESFGTGKELMTRITQQRAGAIIVDADLPDDEGMDTVLQLRNDRSTVRLPILMLAEKGLTRVHSEMAKAFKIPVLSAPLMDQALLAVLNQMFYDFILGVSVPRQTMSSTTVIATPV